MRTCSTARAAQSVRSVLSAYHVPNRESNRELPAEFQCKTALPKNHRCLFCRDAEEEQPGVSHHIRQLSRLPSRERHWHRSHLESQQWVQAAPHLQSSPAQESSPKDKPLPHTVLVTFRRQTNRPGHCTRSSSSKSQFLTTSAKD